ncbi:hypothetical protein FOZ61_006405 [Perkinsus olseni]|uniref:homogentisate 1,2-dioxygenase n=1 Tax=Perkinsus olseni TaxID=32597 RepID=A0A7J6LDD9_PEROL|nr:hypothetical protein FOZ61_006405 [Perkinsus olseni]KAF4661065.1 hypothetical protein FOL46_005874 [Perkinsus olseni]
MTESLPYAVPRNQNSPISPPYGLYPELISGTAFTAPRNSNYYTWTYRKYPSVSQLSRLDDGGGGGSIYRKYQGSENFYATSTASTSAEEFTPEPYRFKATEQAQGLGDKQVDWIDSLFTIAYHKGAACGVYDFDKDMSSEMRVFMHHDADVMLLPRENVLNIRTELGVLRAGPREMVLLPRGIKFTVDKVDDGRARGYFLENFGAPFKIPDLGPVGITSGLAHPRHFRAPTASSVEAGDDQQRHLELISKFNGSVYLSRLNKTPYDVVGWFGNYYPTVYDLGLFMAINTVTYDHPDPSIGVMSEFMGLLYGGYDAKQGFEPGCSSIHNKLSPHGPDRATAVGSSNDGQPERYHGTLAFMWESDEAWIPTEQALGVLKDDTYIDCWVGDGGDEQWERWGGLEVAIEAPFAADEGHEEVPSATIKFLGRDIPRHRVENVFKGALGGFVLLNAVMIPLVVPKLSRRYRGPPYLPSTAKSLDAIFNRLLPRSGVTPAKSTFLDLGSGDGRLVIAAASKGNFRRAAGIELNPWLVLLSKIKASTTSGVGVAPHFYWANAFDAGLIRKIDPQVVTLYGRPGDGVMSKYGEVLEEALSSKGGVVISNKFGIPGWGQRLIGEAEGVKMYKIPPQEQHDGDGTSDAATERERMKG